MEMTGLSNLMHMEHLEQDLIHSTRLVNLPQWIYLQNEEEVLAFKEP